MIVHSELVRLLHFFKDDCGVEDSLMDQGSRLI